MRFMPVSLALLIVSCTSQPAADPAAPLQPLPVAWEQDPDAATPGEGTDGPSVACDPTMPVGWRPERFVVSTGQASPIVSCARFPATAAIVCVFERDDGDLHALRTFDSGTTWSASTRVTNDSAVEHGPNVISDAAHGDVKLVYSIAGGGHDLVIRGLACPECAFSPASNVLADGESHLNASLVALADGALLALEESGGRVRALRSDDDGLSWTAPTIVVDEALALRRPVAVEQDGWVQLVVSDANHADHEVIAQAWSADGGRTWIEHAVLHDTGGDVAIAFAGMQTAGNVTLLATVDGRASHLASWDGGLTFDGPYATSEQAPTTAGTMAVGPAGPVFVYSDGADALICRRYHWGCPE